MSVNIDWIVGESGIKGIEYVCGQNLGENCATGVHIMDNPDTYRFFKKGELVLTTGYVFKQMQDAEIRNMIRAMNDKGCCGMAFKINRFYDTIPDFIIEEANNWCIPILSIPADVAIADLQTVVLREIFEQEKSAKERIESENCFFELFFDKNISQQELEYSCLENGFSTRGTFGVVLYDLKDYAEQKRIVRSEMMADYSCYTFSREIYFAALIKLPEKVSGLEARDCIKAFARDSYSLMENGIAGKSAGFGISSLGDYRSIADMYSQAAKAKEINAAMGETEVLTYDEQAIYHFLLDNITEAALRRMTIPLVTRLDEELLSTLEELVLSGWKYKETAEKLYIHRNTLLFRKNKIFEALSIGETHEQIVDLELAVYAHRLLRAVYALH